MTITALLLLCTAWLWPGHYYPWFSAEQDALALLAVLLLAVAMLARAPRVKTPPACLGVIALAAVAWIQWGMGLLAFRSDAILASIYLGAFALAIAVARNMSAALLPGLFMALLAGALLQLPIGVTQWLGAGDPELIEWVGAGGRVVGNLKQPNQLAALLALGLAATWWFFESRRLGGRLALTAACLLTITLAMTQSRTPWLMAAAWLALWLVLKRRMELRTPVNALVSVALIYVAAAALWIEVNDLLFGASARPLADQFRAGPRTAAWSIAVDAISASPWVGYGWQPFHMAELAVAGRHASTHYRFESAHNLFLDLAVWNGLPLALLLTTAVGVWAVRRVLACSTPTTAAALAALTALLAHSMVEFPLHYAYLLVPAGLLVGLVEAGTRRNGDAADVAVPRGAAIPALVVLAAVSATVFFEYSQWRDSHQMLQYERALRRPTPGYRPWVPDNVLLDGPQALMQLLLLPANVPVPGPELARWRRVAERYATGEALLHYAELARASGRPDEAAHAMSIACRFNSVKDCAALTRAFASQCLSPTSGAADATLSCRPPR